MEARPLLFSLVPVPYGKQTEDALHFVYGTAPALRATNATGREYHFVLSFAVFLPLSRPSLECTVSETLVEGMEADGVRALRTLVDETDPHSREYGSP